MTEVRRWPEAGRSNAPASFSLMHSAGSRAVQGAAREMPQVNNPETRNRRLSVNQRFQELARLKGVNLAEMKPDDRPRIAEMMRQFLRDDVQLHAQQIQARKGLTQQKVPDLIPEARTKNHLREFYRVHALTSTDQVVNEDREQYLQSFVPIARKVGLANHLLEVKGAELLYTDYQAMGFVQAAEAAREVLGAYGETFQELANIELQRHERAVADPQVPLSSYPDYVRYDD